MSIWSKPLTSPQTDEKVRAVGAFGGRLLFLAVILGALAIWTGVVRAIHDYVYTMSAWSDGSSKRGPDDWTPYVVLWSIPVLLAALIALMIRASMEKKKKPDQPAEPTRFARL